MSFEDIAGQDRALKIIGNALRNKTLAHSYIFLGVEGVGKKLTAIELAKAMNCQRSDCCSCDSCPSCNKVNKFSHPDILIIDNSTDKIKIDEVRECQKWISFKPYEGKKKVAIVVNSEKLTREAANSFLKTLEEPPNDSNIILTTTNINSLLPTVVSRCQVVKFDLLDNNIVSDILINKFDVNENEIPLLTQLAKGSAGKAISLAKDGTFHFRNTAIELLKNGFYGDMVQVFQKSKSISSNKPELVIILDFVMDILRDIVLLLNEADEMLLNTDIYDTIRSLSSGLNENEVITFFDRVQTSLSDLKRNANPQLTLETLFISSPKKNTIL